MSDSVLITDKASLSRGLHHYPRLSFFRNAPESRTIYIFLRLTCIVDRTNSGHILEIHCTPKLEWYSHPALEPYLNLSGPKRLGFPHQQQLTRTVDPVAEHHRLRPQSFSTLTSQSMGSVHSFY